FYFDLLIVYPDLHPFPTRRSSDLLASIRCQERRSQARPRSVGRPAPSRPACFLAALQIGSDRRRSCRADEWPGQTLYSHPKTHRSEEHTSELQSRENLVCRLLLEK